MSVNPTKNPNRILGFPVVPSFDEDNILEWNNSAKQWEMADSHLKPGSINFTEIAGSILVSTNGFQFPTGQAGIHEIIINGALRIIGLDGTIDGDIVLRDNVDTIVGSVGVKLSIESTNVPKSFTVLMITTLPLALGVIYSMKLENMTNAGTSGAFDHWNIQSI